jgi:hypothetical protein
MFVFEIFGSFDRDGLVIAVRAWLAVNGDLIAGAGHRPHASSRSRRIAGASGFFTFNQLLDRPRAYREPRRLLTMPSQPSLQAC